MDNEIKTWLFDIKKSINEINTFFDDEQRIFENFQKDLRTKRAIERNLFKVTHTTVMLMASWAFQSYSLSICNSRLNKFTKFYFIPSLPNWLYALL